MIRNIISKGKIKSLIGGILVYSILLIPLIPIFMMYAWLFAQAFSDRVIFGIIPQGFTLSNWEFLLTPIIFGRIEHEPIWVILRNTLILALGVTGIITLISSLSGYALSRIEFKGRTALMQFILVLHAFPAVILLIALFYILNKVGLYGKGLLALLGIIVVKAGMEIPMSAWILKGFFDTIPWELEWAALIDGCTRLGTWRRVILPMILPGIAAVAIFAFIAGWGEFILVYTYVATEEYFSLGVFIHRLIGEIMFVRWGVMAALGVFYLLPVIIFFLLTQKTLLRIYIGGIKR
jgi:inositol-phosphate transport system permease protein